MMTLRSLLEKSSDTDLLREMIGFTAQRLMALEVEGLTGAAPGERSPERINQRNGYRDRVWETRAGPVELRIPKLAVLTAATSTRALIAGTTGTGC
jgi:transposase-like protein